MDIDKIADTAYSSGAAINRLAIRQLNILRDFIQEILGRPLTDDEEMNFQDSFWNGLRDG